MKPRTILFLLLLLPLQFANTLEVGVESSLSNMNFHPDRKPTDLSYSPYYFPLGYSLYGHHTVDETLSLDFGYTSDRILRNYLYSTFSYSGLYYSVEVGPYFGTFNTSETLIKPGMIAAISFRYPGSAYMKLRSARSLNVLNLFSGKGISGSLTDTGDFTQEENEIAVGFYLRNTIFFFHDQVQDFFPKRRC